MPLREDNLVSLIRAVVGETLKTAQKGVRIPHVLAGNVEDIDEDLDVAYIRMDQDATSGDPTQSDNWGNPGVIPATRLGETFVDEQVRVNFDPEAGAWAMRTSAEKRIVLPYGAEDGARIEIDGETGAIYFYSEDNELVGYLDESLWAMGDLTTPGARVTIDPIGGVRIRSAADILVSILDQQGYTLRDVNNGLVVAEVRSGLLRLVDPTGTDDIEMVTSSLGTLPNPKYNSATEADPGVSIVAPSATLFTTTPADDYELYHACAFLPNTSQAATWTPPVGTTERADVIHNTGNNTLSVGIADRDPATGGTGTFTSSQSNWTHGVGTHIIVRGGGATSPTFGSLSEGTYPPTTLNRALLSLAKPTGVVAGTTLIAFVSMANTGGSVPTGWTTPEGWVFLGANYQIRGAGATMSTAAVGAWAKLAGASEPSIYDVSITFGVGEKRLHAAIVAIQNAYLVPGGAHIRMSGHPIRRLLAFNELTADSATLCDFQNIPQGFDHLELVFDGDSNTSADARREVAMRFNNDVGANYNYQDNEDNTLNQALATSRIRLGIIDGASADKLSTGRINVYEYAKVGRPRSVIGDTLHTEVGALMEHTIRGVWTNTTDAINRVTVFVFSGTAQFDTGSRAYLYGY